MDDLTAWIGRSETLRDTLNPTPPKALNSTLDHPAADFAPGTPLPPLWHWLYFLPLHRQSEIGADGRAKRGGFLPPVPLPRRMWAGAASSSSARRCGDLVRRHLPDAEIASFRFKAVRPTFDLHLFRVNGTADGQNVKLWAQDHEGWLTMDATATLR